MPEPRSVIERSLASVGTEAYTLASFHRRRDRRRTRQRLAAGAVGLAIALAVTGSVILRSAPDDVPADTPILRDGEVLQLVDENGPMAALVATDPATGDQRVLYGCSGRCGWIPEFALSADGNWIAWEEACASAGCMPTEHGLWVAGADGSTIPVTSGEQPSAAPGGPDGLWVWAWSTAAEQIAYVTGRSGLAELVLFDPSTGERTSLTTADRISALSWSPDGTEIAIASPSSGVSIIDLANGDSTSIARGGLVDQHEVSWSPDEHDLSWSPDGTRLVLASDGSIIVVSADGSVQRVLVEHGEDTWQGSPAWSPDGTEIAYSGIGSSGQGCCSWTQVWVVGADGSEATRVFHDNLEGDHSGPVWSPDGSRIAWKIYGDRYLVVNADGTGSPEKVNDVVVDGWIQG